MSTMLLRLITSRAARCCSFQAQRLASSKVVIALPHHHQMGGGVAYSYPRQSFHNSTRRCASVSDDELPQQLKDQPGLMEKVHKFMRLLESKGVDIRSGKPPGLTQMAKLAMDGEVRDATTEGERVKKGERDREKKMRETRNVCLK